MAYVYEHRRKDDNTLFYVGIGNDKKKRWAFLTNQRNQIWSRIFCKHGVIVNITHENICWEEACSIEKYLIAFYGRLCKGDGVLANITEGGEGNKGLIHTQETKDKLSALRKGKKLHPDTIAKMLPHLKGRKKGQKNLKPRSEEYKKKMSECAKRRKNTKHSEEWKKAHSEKMKGTGNPNHKLNVAQRKMG